jgi:predicted nucleic acid-binding protein
MGRTYLIDSNAIIDFISNKLPLKGMNFVENVVNAVPNLSIISKMEVLGFPMEVSEEQIFIEFFNDSNIVSISDDIVDKTIEIRKNHKMNLPDAIIAATALTNDCMIISRNSKDFSKIPKLIVINPYDL